MSLLPGKGMKDNKNHSLNGRPSPWPHPRSWNGWLQVEHPSHYLHPSNLIKSFTGPNPPGPSASTSLLDKDKPSSSEDIVIKSIERLSFSLGSSSPRQRRPYTFHTTNLQEQHQRNHSISVSVVPPQSLVARWCYHDHRGSSTLVPTMRNSTLSFSQPGPSHAKTNIRFWQ